MDPERARHINPAYDPLRAPIERARRMEDCDAARKELDAFAHQPEPPPRGWLWDQGWGVIGVAVALIILIALL